MRLPIDILSALALYEFIITFDREIQSIWQRQLSFATVLWVFVSSCLTRQPRVILISCGLQNRYTLILAYCPIILGVCVRAARSCVN